MPIYEYYCTQCRKRFEVLQAIGASDSGLSCPKCHAPNPRRLISPFFNPDPLREPPKKHWQRGAPYEEYEEAGDENVVMPSGRTLKEEKEIIKSW